MFESLWGSKKEVAPPASEGAADKCPVDHSTRAAWLAANPGAGSPFDSKTPAAAEGFTQAAASTNQDSESSSPAAAATVPPPPPPPPSTGRRMRTLSEDRVISSIPRHASSSAEASSSSTPPADSSPAHSSADDASSQDKNWVYPSEAQFFRAMLRKHQSGAYANASGPPNPADMKTIVPIHNAVNEKAWAEVLKWEDGEGGDNCGGIRLSSFQGRPKDRTPKAWINTALGYTAPFDRHDWIIDRCGTQVRYVIDFYSGRPPSSKQLPPGSPDPGNLSFYLDVRPALDNWEGVRLRAGRLFGLK